ncbi:MAG: hypothetical protein K2X27_09430, partial [Candidatus Obscuribacterales bacterium]|nr:hypothetical protein [Candidatus Obscuribacterales bacterium]
IIHKLFGSSKIIAAAVERAQSRRNLGILLTILLIYSSLICISEKVSVFLAQIPTAFAGGFLPYFYFFFQISKGFIWNQPSMVLCCNWFSWVLLADILVYIGLISRNKLSGTRILRLFLITCLAFLMIWEYVFQLGSFSRSPTHSVIALFLFACWLLWLMHTVFFPICSRSTPAFPSESRFSIYAGVLSLVTLEIFARASLKDFKLINELFLSMYRGIIDFGIPYYLLLWSSRKLENRFLSVATMLAHFVCGAMLALLFNLISKFSIAHWTLSGAISICTNQLKLLENTGSINLDLRPDSAFYLLRAFLLCLSFCIVYFLNTKSERNDSQKGGRLIFCLLSLSSGTAAFSNSLMELPLPKELRAWTAPLTQDLSFNCHIFETVISFWLPALILGLGVLIAEQKKLKTTWTLLGSLALSFLSAFLIPFLFDYYECFWRATGSIYSVVCAAISFQVAIILAALMLLQNEPGVKSIHSASAEDAADLLSYKTVFSLLLSLSLLLASIAGWQSAKKMQVLPLSSANLSFTIFSDWKPLQLKQKPNEKQSFLFKKTKAGLSSEILQIGSIDSSSDGNLALMKDLIQKAAKNPYFKNFQLLSIKSVNRYFPNALACQYSFEEPIHDSKLYRTRAGVTVLLPVTRGPKLTQYLSIYCDPADLEQETYSLLWTIEKAKPI